MQRDGIDFVLTKNGYTVMQSNVPLIKFYIKKTDYGEKVFVIGCISTAVKNSLTVEQLENVAAQIERKMLLTGGRQVEILYLIYSDNIERDKVFNTSRIQCWLIDVLAGQLMIFEDQPYEFDGLRKQIQESLEMIRTQRQYQGAEGVHYQQNNTIYIPIVTILLILCNTIIFFILESRGSTENAIFMMEHGATYSKLVFDGKEYYRLFTSMFLHFGIVHLANNMFALWFIGGEVERMHGHLKYLVIYLLSGLAGNYLSAVFSYISDRMEVSAGASGAVYGILGALLVLVLKYGRNGNSKIYKMVVVLFFLVMAGQRTGNVDNIAHLGGFIAGVILGFLFMLMRERPQNNSLRDTT